MASISDYLDTMVVTVSSPDTNVRAKVSDYTKITIGFRPGSFDRYDEETLAHQLTRLGATTFASYRRGRAEAWAKSQGFGDEDVAAAVASPGPAGESGTEYREELNAVEATGVSTGREIRIRTRGMLRWKVDIKPGAVARLGEKRFLAELNSAIQAWQSDRRRHIVLLKSRHFDLGLPKKWRRILDDARAINARRA